MTAAQAPVLDQVQPRAMHRKRWFSEVSVRPRPQWVQLPSVILHPDTHSQVFQWEMSGDKRALRILCNDLCEGLAQLAAESPRVRTEYPGHIVVEPYELLFHNKARIKEDGAKKLGNGNCQTHLRFLVDYLEEKEKPRAWGRIDAIEQGRCKTITFDSVPLLYSRGDTVLQNKDGVWRAYVIEKHESKMSAGMESMLIHAQYLDFDKTGNSLVPHATVFELPKFESEQLITRLELIPRQFLDQRPELIDSIKDRGAEYYKYGREVRYCEYQGSEWPRPLQKAPLRVIVDYVTPSSRTQALGLSDARDPGAFCTICAAKTLGLASYPEDIDHGPFMCEPELKDIGQHQFGPEMDQSEDPFLFCPPSLWAFSLYYRTWSLVSPYDLKEVEKRDEPFDNELLMDSGLKKHFRSIAEEYMNILKPGGSSQNLVQKGGGFNVLLCGNTGVGKTFTAECLSEKYGLPLYTMTCGDLGDDPESFDLKLHEMFLRGINWGAIVLLDAVDDYVYSRNRMARRRNYLAPILLRHLETSESLNIITITDALQADEAFLGRLHLSLHLEDFTFNCQKRLWRQAFKSISSETNHELEDFVDNELEKFENGLFREMNARQITNAELGDAIEKVGPANSPGDDFPAACTQG
ncbi:hypothetical protein PG987_015291 [Apiospora arundinis]